MTVNHGVLGSSPCSGARRETMSNATFGSLAQLVQSICLTSRGSAVRIRQLPLSKTRDWKFQSLFFVVCGMKTSFHHLQQKNSSLRSYLAFVLWKLAELELRAVAGIKIYLFSKVFPLRLRRSNPSTPTNQTSKKMLRNQHLFLFCMA